MQYSKILATASYVPKNVRTNADLEQILGTDPETGTTDEWIRSRVGIMQRRIAAPFETHQYMAVHAVKYALNEAGIAPEECTVILAGNTHEPGLIPSRASEYHKALALGPIPAFDILSESKETAEQAAKYLLGENVAHFNKTYALSDINTLGRAKGVMFHHEKEGLAQVVAGEMGMNREQSFDVACGCASYNYALALADAIIKKEPQYIVVAAVDKMLGITNPEDRSTVVLFGELASATVLGPSKHPGFTGHLLYTDSSQRDAICMKRNGISQEYFWQDGQVVYKWAVQTIHDLTEKFIELTDGRRVLIPHQANPRMLQHAFKNKLFRGIADAVITGDMFGNSSTASIAHALDVGFAGGRIQPGDYLGILGFGAGLTSGINIYKNA